MTDENRARAETTRLLHNAEGILVACRRYSPDAAREEIDTVARLYGLTQVQLATDLIGKVADLERTSPSAIADVVRGDWDAIIVRGHRA